MKKLFCLAMFFLFIFLCFAYFADDGYSKEYKASIARMPVYAIDSENGVLVDLIKAIAKTSGHKITIQVVDFEKSMEAVMSKKVDFHLPLIKPINLKENPFDLSEVTIFHVNFVLYTNNNLEMNGISIYTLANTCSNIKIKTKEKCIEANEKWYEIYTDAAHIHLFPIPFTPTKSIVKSIRDVNYGWIHGFIFSNVAIDPLIKKYRLTHIKRDLYQRFDVKIILPKDHSGNNVDKMLSETIKEMRKTGEFQKIMDCIDKPYDKNWKL